MLNNNYIGTIILILWTISGMIFLFSPGSVRIQKPEGGLITWLYNILHLVYEIILIPLTAVLILSKNTTVINLIQFKTEFAVIPVAGLFMICIGVMLFSWARIVLKRSFRIAAVIPGKKDKLFTNGPYHLIRNPMYTSVLCNCLGLTLLTQIYVFAFLFVIFFFMQVFAVIPAEEKQLQDAYGSEYQEYMERTKRIVPFVY